MRKLLRWISWALLGLIVAVGILYALAWYASNKALARRYAIHDAPLTIVRDPATIAHGKHLFISRGCQDCHGVNGIGHLVFDAGPVMRLVAPNLTPTGLGSRYDADKIAAAIRHGMRADGRALVFMPSPDFADLSDEDVASLVAYVQSLPPSGNRPGSLEIRPLARLMYFFGAFPLTPAEHIDHAPRVRAAPAAAPTAAFGAYLAGSCKGCHGDDLAGQDIPGAPPGTPRAANLTQHEHGLKKWSEADFIRALRTGKRPDGSALNPMMPWQSFSQLSDTELQALWVYLHQLPPKGRKD